jgi:hypothetical protein
LQRLHLQAVTPLMLHQQQVYVGSQLLLHWTLLNSAWAWVVVWLRLLLLVPRPVVQEPVKKLQWRVKAQGQQQQRQQPRA